jgi:NADH-quinone oxidoreductase subunit L
VGVPQALYGNNAIEHFLEPSFTARHVVLAPGEHSSEGGTLLASAAPQARTGEGETVTEPAGAEGAAGHAAEGDSAAAAQESHGSEGGHLSQAGELGLMLLSVAIAALGIGVAYRFYVRAPEIADRLAARWAGPHRVLLNKYYVDELYDAVIVQPIKRTSERALWRFFDAGVIDGAVNGTGSFVNGASAILRRLQTGSMRAYALSVFVGVVVILGYYVWR